MKIPFDLALSERSRVGDTCTTSPSTRDERVRVDPYSCARALRIGGYKAQLWVGKVFDTQLPGTC